MRVKKLTDAQFLELIVNKELEIANAPIRYIDLVGPDKDKYPHWYMDYAFDTVEQYKEWRQFFYDHFYDWKPKREKDVKRWFSMFALQYGLKYNFSYDKIKDE